MRRKITLTIAAITLLIAAGAGIVEVSKGTTFDPSGSNAVYYMGQDINFSQVTVYTQTVNFSTTNVTTNTSGHAVNVTFWKHNFTKSTGTVAKYNYNDSADTQFYRLDSSKSYQVKFDGSVQRTVSGQEWLNVSVPADTNLTVEKADSFNSAPDAPSNPSPSDGATGTATDATLSVDVSDPDGDSMDVTFYNASDGSVIGTESNVANDTTASTTWSGLSEGTTYSWKAEADDGTAATNSSTFSFTTNYNPELVSDSHSFSDNAGSHEFTVTAQAEDGDGDDDFTECKVYWEEDDGNSGLLTGTLDTSAGDENVTECSGTIDNSLSGVEVGEGVNVSVRFTDGTAWANTTEENHTVPNSAPTNPTSFDLKKSGKVYNSNSYVTDHTPPIQWSGESDPDGDAMNITAYTDTAASPTTQDNEADAGSASMNLGEGVTLNDNTTYYYRLRVCDEYGKCATGYTSDGEFKMNEEPDITSHSVNNSSPDQGDTVHVEADVTDGNIDSVNFTVWNGSSGNKIIDNQEGTLSGGIWNSPDFTVDVIAEYNYTVKAYDNVSEQTEETGSVSLSFKDGGFYTRTYSTSEQVNDARIELYGTTDSGSSFDVEVNTSAGSPTSLENDTWKDVESGQDLTLNITFNTDGTSTPQLSSYKLSYRTEYDSPGYMKSTIKNFSSPKTVKEVSISEDEPDDTNSSYYFRVGDDNTPPTGWNDWVFCDESCDPGLAKKQYFQYRVNMTGNATHTPRLDEIEVRYE